MITWARIFDGLESAFDGAAALAFRAGYHIRNAKEHFGQALYKIPIIGPARDRWAVERARAAMIYLDGLYRRDVH